MGIAVIGADGRLWEVRRVWFRRLRLLDWFVRDTDPAALVHDPLVALTAKILAAPIVVPARAFGLRPFRIEAVTNAVPIEAWAWEVRGFGQTRRAMRELEEAIRAGREVDLPWARSVSYTLT